MRSSRRQFLGRSGAAIAAVTLAPRFLHAGVPAFPDDEVDYKALTELARNAVDAAQQAGASYADCRITIVDRAIFQRTAPSRTLDLCLGVRALVDGYWGLSFSPILRKEEAVRLGRDAVLQAGAYNIGKVRRVEYVPIKNRVSGHWVMPVQIDPFALPHEEIADFLEGLKTFIERLPQVKEGRVLFSAVRTDKIFVSSEQQVTTQRLYRGKAFCDMTLSDGSSDFMYDVEGLGAFGKGWEIIKTPDIRDKVREVHAEGLEDMKLPFVPVDVGRHPMLLDSESVAGLLLQSIGHATEFDRILGFEANDSGTSYVTAANQVGMLKLGYNDMTVIANQSIPGSVAWTKWDDEGVTPTPVTLVNNGMLTGVQTSRESPSWVDSSGDAVWQPVGCAVAPTASYAPMIGTCDIALQPNPTDTSIETMRSGMGKGIELKRGGGQFDFQKSTSFILGRMYGIQNGRRMFKIVGGAGLMRTTEFWKNIIAAGGKSTVQRFGIESRKGQPIVERWQTSCAPALLCKEISILDLTRKA